MQIASKCFWLISTALLIKPICGEYRNTPQRTQYRTHQSRNLSVKACASWPSFRAALTAPQPRFCLCIVLHVELHCVTRVCCFEQLCSAKHGSGAFVANSLCSARRNKHFGEIVHLRAVHQQPHHLQQTKRRETFTRIVVGWILLGRLRLI